MQPPHPSLTRSLTIDQDTDIMRLSLQHFLAMGFAALNVASLPLFQGNQLAAREAYEFLEDTTNGPIADLQRRKTPNIEHRIPDPVVDIH
ncbi:MAG: hypothetical protein Q9210_003023 [Variospora velana]